MEVVGKEVGEMRNRLDLEVFMMVMEIDCMFEGKKWDLAILTQWIIVDYRE